MADIPQSLVLGRVIEVQEKVEGLMARVQRLDRKVGIETDWLAISSPMASVDSGFCFTPQAGEEDGDIAVIAYAQKRGVILGFIYGPNKTASDKPEELAITSRDGNTVILTDGDDSGITLQDKHNNQIIMNKDGITLKSDKDIKIEAGGTTTVIGTTVELNP
jgi:hypothetical protein